MRPQCPIFVCEVRNATLLSAGGKSELAESLFACERAFSLRQLRVCGNYCTQRARRFSACPGSYPTIAIRSALQTRLLILVALVALVRASPRELEFDYAEASRAQFGQCSLEAYGTGRPLDQFWEDSRELGQDPINFGQPSHNIDRARPKDCRSNPTAGRDQPAAAVQQVVAS